MSGTRKAHLVQLQGRNYYSKFYVQLAGGFNASNDWLGQIQQGVFDSRRAVLKQQQNAAVIFNRARQELFVGQHCRPTKPKSRLCFDQPLRVSQQRGNVSFATRNLDLNDFAAFMPEGRPLLVSSMVTPRPIGPTAASLKSMHSRLRVMVKLVWQRLIRKIQDRR